MELGLKGNRIIVTGGASNIGKAIVLALAAEGCHIAIAEIDEARASWWPKRLQRSVVELVP